MRREHTSQRLFFFGSQRTSENAGVQRGARCPVDIGLAPTEAKRRRKPFVRVEGGSHHRVKGETPCQCPEADTGGPRRNPAQRFRWGEEEQGSERSFRRKAETELSGLCDDEGRVQGGSACWVSRGQSPLGLVQGDNACSGVQRVKPLAQ